MTGIHVKYELNSNTIIIVMGFLSTLVTFVFFVSNSQHSIADNARLIAEHDMKFKAVDDRFDAIDKRDAEMRDLLFRVGALEKGQEVADTRVNRIVESYGSKFTELSGQMNIMLTQQALMTQSLQRIEAVRAEAAPPK